MAKQKKPHVIKDLQVQEVSLVDRPANQHAHVMLFKREAGETPCATCQKVHDGDCAIEKNFTERVAAFFKKFFVKADVAKRPVDFNTALATSNLWDITNAFDTALRSALTDSTSQDEAIAAVGVALSQFNTKIIDIVSAGLSPSDNADADPDAGGSSGDYNTEKRMTKAEKEAKEAALRKQLSDLEAEQPTDVAPVAVVKADPAQAEQLKKVESENEDLRKRLEAVEKVNRDRELLDEATKLVGKSGLDPKEIATLLANGDDISKAIVKKLCGQTAEMAKSARLFEEIGSSDTDELDANAELETVVKELRKNDPKLTKEQAIAKAYTMYPELYDESDESDADDDIEVEA